jgi:thiamine-monophosphate kinase
MFGSEAEFVDWLKRVCRARRRGVTVGIGDDAAIVRPGRNQEIILTTDLSIEGVHFLRRLHPARSVGHRALARALSDVAAMGGTPRYALVSLAISRRTTRRWVKDFYAGAQALASRTGVAIIGGDTALVPGPAPQCGVDAVVAGEVPRGTALLRSGARPGDLIFVSGRLGLSALGLRMLKSGRPATRRRGLSEPLRAHLYPEPRLGLGRFLRVHGLASALMDLSDGLSTDLSRLLKASGAGAVLRSERIPLAITPGERARAGLPTMRSDLLALALNGGEDYELLFTVPQPMAGRIPKRFRGLPISCIGEIRRSPGLFLALPDGTIRPIQPGGFEHFRRDRKGGV